MENKTFVRSPYHGKLSSCRLGDGRKVYAHGLCNRHYLRLKRNGDPEILKKPWREHGLSSHPLYLTWDNMMDRCYNQADISYKNYGARGLKVYKSWHKLENFIVDIGSTIGGRPSLNHTFDRINNDDDYKPGNVRWATRQEQAFNRNVLTKNKSGFKGVCWNKTTKRWISYIGGKASGGQKRLGSFKELSSAINARKKEELLWKKQGLLV